MKAEDLERLASLQQELLTIYEFWTKFVCETTTKGEFMPYGGFDVVFRVNEGDDNEFDTQFNNVFAHPDQMNVRDVCFEALMVAFRKRAVDIVSILHGAGITDLDDPPEGMYP